MSRRIQECFARYTEKGGKSGDAVLFLMFVGETSTSVKALHEMVLIATAELTPGGTVGKLAGHDSGGWRARMKAWSEAQSGSIPTSAPTVDYLSSLLTTGEWQAVRRPAETTEQLLRRLRRVSHFLRTDRLWQAMAEDYERRLTGDGTVLHPAFDQGWIGPWLNGKVPKVTKVVFGILQRRAERDAARETPPGYAPYRGAAVAPLELRMPKSEELQIVKDRLGQGYVVRWWDPRWRTRFFTNSGVEIDRQWYPVYYANGDFMPNVVGVVLLIPGGSTMHSHATAMLYSAQRFSDEFLAPSKVPYRLPDGAPAVLATVGFDNPAHGEGPSWRDFQTIDAFLAYYLSIITYFNDRGRPVVLFGRSLGADIGMELTKRCDGLVAGAHFMGGERPQWGVHALQYLFERFVGKDGRGAERNIPGITLIMRLFGLWQQDREITPEEMTGDNLVRLAEQQRPHFTYADGIDAIMDRMRVAATAFTVPEGSQVFGARRTLSFDEVMRINWGKLEVREPATWVAVQEYMASIRFRADLTQPQTPTSVLHGLRDEEYPPDAWKWFQRFAVATGARPIINPAAGHDHMDPRRSSEDASLWSFSRVRDLTVQWVNAWRRKHVLEVLRG